MREISFQTIRRIFELHFKGCPRDVTARKVGVSTGTVSNVIGLLPESLDELRALSVELRKSGKSLHEASEGAKLCRKLKEMNVELDQMESYVKATKKYSRKAGYEPKQVVQAEMRLSDLEEISGKSYLETIEEFETKTIQIKNLEKKESALQEEIQKIVEKRKQKLRQNRTTDKEIKYNKDLRQKFHRYGISLTDAENLKKYLQNMKETRSNPKKFLEFTRKHGSLKGRLTYLENQKQQKTLELDKVKGTLETSKATLATVKNLIEKHSRALQELNQKEGMKLQSIATLNKEEAQLKERLEAAFQELAGTLKVKAETEEIRKAINLNREKLNLLNSKIEAKGDELAKLRSEIQRTLNIKDYTLELTGAISTLEQKKISLEKQNAVLEKENEKRKGKIAVADTVTNFLRRKPDYEFNRFRSMVEDLKRAREDRSSPLRRFIPRIEEQIRMKALEAFEGDIISKPMYNALWKRKEKYRNETVQKDETIRTLKEEQAKKDIKLKILEAVKVDFEGRPTTLEDLRRLTMSIQDKEIERRANEKYDRLAALAQGTLNFIGDMRARKGKEKNSS